jgi:cytochrome P450
MLVKLTRFVPIPFISEATEKRRRIRGYADESIQRHQRIVEEQGDDAKPTLLSKLYNLAGTEKLTFAEVSDNASAYIIAGSDTTVSICLYSDKTLEAV